MKYDLWFLLELAESTNAPSEQPSDSVNWCHDVVFNCKNGWKVVIFYDCGELDYISYFINPDGLIIDFWDWPDEFEVDDPRYEKALLSSDKNFLMNWRGVGDIERLRADYKYLKSL
jgi:hypothetical protein